MANYETSDETAIPFQKVSGFSEYTIGHTTHRYETSLVAVDPLLIGRYEAGDLSRAVVGKILAHTFNSMTDYGASALGLDADSMAGQVHAVGHIEAAAGTGARILEDLAPREDGTRWQDWIHTHFHAVLATVYGPESTPAKLTIAQDR